MSMQETFGERLTRLRAGRGMTCYALAKAVKCSQIQISLYESGVAEPKASRLFALAAAVGVDVQEFQGVLWPRTGTEKKT